MAQDIIQQGYQHPRGLPTSCECACRPAKGWVRRVVDRMLEEGRLAGGDAMRRVQTERMGGHEGRIKQDALQRGGRSSPLHNLNQDRRELVSGTVGWVAWWTEPGSTRCCAGIGKPRA